MKKKYQGIFPPIITPVDEKEHVDEEGFRSLIEHCVTNGIHGLFVAGTNGETMALTQKERNRAIRIALDQVKGRIPVMCGVMDTSTKRVIENIKELEQMGGSCAAVTSVFYDRHTSQDETVRHFEAIAKATDVDLMVYNIPPFTGLKLEAATVLKIAEIDQVKGYKDSSGDFTGFLQVLAQYEHTPFSCLEGITPHSVPALLMGADGMVPALAPRFPGLFVKAYEAGRDKNIELAKRYNEIIRESSKILKMTINDTAATKYAISQLGMTHKRVMMPQDVILPKEEEAIDRQAAKVEEMLAELERSVGQERGALPRSGGESAVTSESGDSRKREV